MTRCDWYREELVPVSGTTYACSACGVDLCDELQKDTMAHTSFTDNDGVLHCAMNMRIDGKYEVRTWHDDEYHVQDIYQNLGDAMQGYESRRKECAENAPFYICNLFCTCFDKECCPKMQAEEE